MQEKMRPYKVLFMQFLFSFFLSSLLSLLQLNAFLVTAVPACIWNCHKNYTIQNLTKMYQYNATESS